MPTWMLYGLKAGLAGGLASLLMLPVCALLRRARAPGWLICALWGAVGLRFALPDGVIPLPLPQTRTPALAQAAVQVEQLEALSPAAATPTTAAAITDAGSGWGIWQLLGVLWLAGALVLALRALVRYRGLRHSLALACRTPDGAYSCTAVTMPFTLGILRPRVYLPDSLQGPARAAVLLHERTHIRRRDPLTKPLFYLIVCLHWWNPLAWLAFGRFELSMEYACDEAAVRGKNPAQRAQYCESLLQFAVGNHTPGCLAFGQLGVKARIRHLLRYRKPALPVLMLSLIGAVLAATVCMAAPRQSTAPAVEQPAAAGTGTTTESAQTEKLSAFSPEMLTSPLDFYLYLSRQYSGTAHRGDDLAAPVGTPVYAAAAGTVVVADFHYSYGNYIVIDHGKDQWGKDWQTLYAHLEGLYVTAGDTVTAHQFIGTVGNTGTSTGPHLHLELQCDGERMAPTAWITYRSTSDPGSLLASLLEAAPRIAPDLTTDASFGSARQQGQAVADGPGVVLYTAQTDQGWYLLLYHGYDTRGNGYASLYTGLQDCTVRTGQQLTAGEVVGSTGTETSFQYTLLCNGQPVSAPTS